MRHSDTLAGLRDLLDEQGFKLVASADRGQVLTLDYLYPGMNEREDMVLTVRVTLEDLGGR